MFETVSIERSANDETRGRLQVKPGAILGTNTTLKRLISYAYGEEEALVFGPRWVETAGYDIIATANGPAGDAQLCLMLQNVLRDRFKIVVRRETKDIPVYLLIVPEGGPKLRDANEEQRFRAAGPPAFKPGYGFVYTGKDLPGLAERLSRGIGRPVIDKTEIKGHYWLSCSGKQTRMNPESRAVRWSMPCRRSLG